MNVLPPDCILILSLLTFVPFSVHARKPWKIRLPLLLLHKDLEKSSYRVGSDAVITQDIVEDKSEKPSADNQ